MAKLPPELVRPKRRKLADLLPGERSLFPLYAIKIDEEHNAYAVLGTELPPPIDTDLEYGEIWRDESGEYHLLIKTTRRRWRTEDLRLYFATKGLIVPMKTLAWSPGPG